jgi:hypothetical protein
VVAIGGAPEGPVVLAKTRIDVATTFDEGAVFHVAQARPLGEARKLVRAREALFTRRARAALAEFVGTLDAKVVGIGLAAGPEKVLPPFETILKAHPLLHAAEGELYRRVFAAAGARGARVVRLPPSEALARLAAARRVTVPKVAAHLAAMGKASGAPWAADQKQAALAAWLVFLSADPGLTRG